MLEIRVHGIWRDRAEAAAWVITAGLVVLVLLKGGPFAMALFMKLYEIFIEYNTAGLV